MALVGMDSEYKNALDVVRGDVIRWLPESLPFEIDGEVVGVSHEGEDIVLEVVEPQGTQRHHVTYEPYDGVEVVGWAE